MPGDRKEASALERVSRLQQEKLTLAEEVKAQKVKILLKLCISCYHSSEACWCVI